MWCSLYAESFTYINSLRILTQHSFEIGIIVVPHFTGEKTKAQGGKWLPF